MRWLLAGVAVVAAALVAVFGGGEQRVVADGELPPVETIAKRVEAIRGLRFNELPKVERVTAKQLQAQADREAAALSQKELDTLVAETELMKLLGFVDPKAKPGARVDTSDILGRYEPKTKTLTIVADAQGDKTRAELTLAHELAHALEDDAFGLDLENRKGDDAAAAYRALGEGSAQVVEAAYARRHLGGDLTRSSIARRDVASIKKAAPDYEVNAQRFAYVDGARFVARLQREGGWRTVNSAFSTKPPASSEQVLHPETYFDSEPAKPVRLNVRSVVGKKLQRVAAGTFGEFDTAQLLVFGAGNDEETTRADAARAASGWAGGRYELWRAGRTNRGCSSPCVERDVLVLGWRWDRRADAAQFAKQLVPYLEEFQGLRQVGRRMWRGDVAHAALAVSGRETTLAIAPVRPLAKLLALRGN